MLTETILVNLSKLEYSELWIESGLLTIDGLAEQIEAFKAGEDTNKEHYRYKTFRSFINKQSSINNPTLQQIIEILKSDNDKVMVGSVTIELLKTKYLTEQQFDQLAIFF